MRRGELTNAPAPVLAVDWRVLVDARPAWGGLSRRYELRDGARGWLERNWKVRVCVLVDGGETQFKEVKKILRDLVAEFASIPIPQEFRIWMRRTPHIFRLYTNDRALLGLDDTVRLFPGWHEVVVV